jgi:acyl-CoA thioester hydrolase
LACPRRRSTVRIRIPFHDLDPMGIVWHGNYLKYLEIARQALFDESGLDLYRHAAESGYLLPIIRTSCTHLHVLRLRDEIAVTASIVEVRYRIVLDYVVTIEPSGTVAARARSEQAAVKLPHMELQLAIPPDIQAALAG